MFAKLLRYEWRASRGLVGLLCAIIGVSSLLSGGIARYMTWSVVTGNRFMVSVYSSVLSVAVLAIAGCCVGAMYLLVYRFYTGRFTDQGYLMMTLPVTAHQHMLSCLTNTVIGVLVVAVTAVVCVTAGVSIFLSSFEQDAVADMLYIFEDVAKNLEAYFDTNGILVSLVVGGLIAIFLTDILSLMLALTVGAHAAKHPVLKGAVLYIGLDVVVNEINSFISPWANRQFSGFSVGEVNVLTTLLLYTVTAVVCYYATHQILENKLNLA